MEKVQQIDTRLACFLVLANTIGIELKADDIRKRFQLQDKLMTEEMMYKVGKYFGMRVRLRKTSIHELRHLVAPFIAEMKNGSFVVIGSFEENFLLVLDPTKGPNKLTLEEFDKVWSGRLFMCKKRFSWHEFRKAFNIDWFLPVLTRYKRMFMELTLAAFFLQIFGLAMPLFTQVIIDKVLPNNGLVTLDVLAIVLMVVILFQVLLTALRTHLFAQTTNKIDVILGARLFRHIVALPLSYFETRRVGDTLIRVSAMSGIRDFMTGPALTSIMDTFFVFVFIALMMYYSIPLTLVALCVLPFQLFQNIIAMPIFQEKLEKLWAAEADNNAFVVEAVTGIQTIKSMAIEPQFKYKWENLTARTVTSSFSVGKFYLWMNNSISLLQKLSGIFVLWYGGHLVINGQMTIGQLIAFQMLASQANTPLMNLLGLWQSLQQTGLAAERLGDVLNTATEEEQGKKDALKEELRGDILFKDTYFSYKVDGALVLKNINVEFKAGQRIGIVGRSGSGKSTFTKLVQGLYKPDQGNVYVDGQDINTLEQTAFRSKIGVVLQENFLFAGTVRENIALADPGAAMSDVIRAAEMAGAHEFILELSEGYDTKVSEGGAGLSGGQRQRVAIARALLTDPRILVFDEATSALDYQSEKIIMDNLDAICQGRTVMMIAHRLSTVRNCDRIIVIEKGQIIEDGSHEELIANNGFYAYLYQQQEGVSAVC